MRSLRQAINAKCRDCIHDPLAGETSLQQIIDCTCTSCPLFPVRPKRKPSAESRNSARQRRETVRAAEKH